MRPVLLLSICCRTTLLRFVGYPEDPRSFMQGTAVCNPQYSQATARDRKNVVQVAQSWQALVLLNNPIDGEEPVGGSPSVKYLLAAGLRKVGMATCRNISSTAATIWS